MTTTRQPMKEIVATIHDIAHQVTIAKPQNPVRFVAYDKSGLCEPFAVISLREVWKLELLEKMAGSENPDFVQIAGLFETHAIIRAKQRDVRKQGKQEKRDFDRSDEGRLAAASRTSQANFGSRRRSRDQRGLT